ncbi:MAG: VPDSG-CTERM sorting domain-containing protein [Azonexus sp.]
MASVSATNAEQPTPKASWWSRIWARHHAYCPKPPTPTVVHNVPDGGATAALLGSSFLGLWFMRRRVA